MSVKEVLQSLVDDSMVDTEKIGTSVYFWALPSKASQNVREVSEEANSAVVGRGRGWGKIFFAFINYSGTRFRGGHPD